MPRKCWPSPVNRMHNREDNKTPIVPHSGRELLMTERELELFSGGHKCLRVEKTMPVSGIRRATLLLSIVVAETPSANNLRLQ